MKNSRRFFDRPNVDLMLSPRFGGVGSSRTKLVNTTPTGTVISKPTTTTTTTTTTTSTTTTTTTIHYTQNQFVIFYNSSNSHDIYGWDNGAEACINGPSGMTMSVYSDSVEITDGTILYSNSTGSPLSLFQYFYYPETDSTFKVIDGVISESTICFHTPYSYLVSYSNSDTNDVYGWLNSGDACLFGASSSTLSIYSDSDNFINGTALYSDEAGGILKLVNENYYYRPDTGETFYISRNGLIGTISNLSTCP